MIDHFADKKAQLEALPQDASIDDILDAAYRILGNPTLMFDTSYNLLAHAKDIVTDDRFWNELVETGTFSHESVDFFNSEHFILSFSQSEVLSLMRSDKLKYDRINGKLFDSDNVQLGNICTVACFKPFEDGDEALIEMLCELLSEKLRCSDLYPRIDRVYEESCLDGLLTGKLNGCAAKDCIAELYAGLKSNLYLAVVDVTRYDQTMTHLAYFRDLFRKLQPQHKYYVHMNSIVAFLSTDRAMLSPQRDLDELGRFFINNRIFAGISSQFDSLDDLQKRHREAINALNYGLTSRRDQHIFFYDDYRVEHYINTVGPDLDALCCPVISHIQEYDRQNGHSLLDTLYMYLLYGLDAASAARALGTEPAALSLRLRQLEDQFGIDWRNGDMLTNLFISLKTLDNT